MGQLWDIPYLVLEYVPGESLDQLCEALFDAGKVVPPPIVVRIIADTCRGLHAAHELLDENGEPLGLVHRDVSPQNILVNDRGRAMLISFGSREGARAPRSRDRQQRSGGRQNPLHGAGARHGERGSTVAPTSGRSGRSRTSCCRARAKRAKRRGEAHP